MVRRLTCGLIMACFGGAPAAAQSGFNGTWKFAAPALPEKPFVWLLRDGTYRCDSCTPPVNVEANGQDQKVAGQPYDTISVTVVDARIVREIEKKNGRVVSNETFTVSPDGKTVTDEFALAKMTAVRVANGPPGSHALSGTWQVSKIETTSDSGLLMTIKIAGNNISMSGPGGRSYTAKLDGTDAPYAGDPDTTSVSVQAIDGNTIEESEKRNGVVTTVTRMTISPDGKTMTILIESKTGRSTNRFTTVRQ